MKLNSEWPGELLSQVPHGWYLSLQRLFTFLGWVLRYSGIYLQGVEWRWCWCHWAVIWMALMACVQRPAWHMVNGLGPWTQGSLHMVGRSTSRYELPNKELYSLSLILCALILYHPQGMGHSVPHQSCSIPVKSHQNINSRRARTVSLGFTSVSLEPAQCQTQIRYLIPFPHHPCCRNPTLNWT